MDKKGICDLVMKRSTLEHDQKAHTLAFRIPILHMLMLTSLSGNATETRLEPSLVILNTRVCPMAFLVPSNGALIVRRSAGHFEL